MVIKKHGIVAGFFSFFQQGYTLATTIYHEIIKGHRIFQKRRTSQTFYSDDVCIYIQMRVCTSLFKKLNKTN